MSTIIDALKQAERESKSILSEEEDALVESAKADKSEALETPDFEEEKKQCLTAFTGAGAGGWYLYETEEAGPTHISKNVASSKKISTATVSYNVSKPPRIQSKLFNKEIVNRSKAAETKTVSLAKQTPPKNNAKKLVKKISLAKAAFGENKKGILLYGKSEIEKARDEFLNAIKSKPNMAEAHFNLALVYEDMKKTDDAESEYKKVISLNGKFTDAYINLGVIYNNQKRYSDAQKVYEKVLEIEPNEPTAHFNLGVLYAYYIKEPIKAIFHWKRYIRISPKSGNLAVIKKEIAKLATT